MTELLKYWVPVSPVATLSGHLTKSWQPKMFSWQIFPFSPWPILTDCSVEFRPQQAAAPINNGLCSWRMEQAAWQAPNVKCRLSGAWPDAQACFILNYGKGSGVWVWVFGVVFFIGYEERKTNKNPNHTQTKNDPTKQFTKVIHSPVPGHQNSALKYYFFLVELTDH